MLKDLRLSTTSMRHMTFSERAVTAMTIVTVSSRKHVIWYPVIGLLMRNCRSCVEDNRLCHPRVVRVQDWLMHHRWGLMEYNGWLMINDCWPMNNNRRLMVDDRWSVEHYGSTVNHDIRAMIDFRGRVIDYWWTMHHNFVFSLPLFVFCVLGMKRRCSVFMISFSLRF